MRIRKTFLILILIALIVPFVITTIILTLQFEHKNHLILEERITLLAASEAAVFKDFFAERVLNMDIITDTETVKQLLHASNASTQGGAQSAAHTIMQNFLIDILRSRANAQPFLLRLSVINKNNYVIASNETSTIGSHIIFPQDMASVPEGSSYITALNINPQFYNGIAYFELAIPIYYDNSYQGFTVAVMTTNYFEKQIYGSYFFRAGHITLIDSQQNIVVSSDPIFNTSHRSLENNTSFYEQWKTINFSIYPKGLLYYTLPHSGKTYVGYYMPIENSGSWKIICTVGWEEINNIAQDTTKTAVFIIVILALISITLYVILRQKIIVPLSLIFNTISKVENGHYDIYIKSSIKNELGNLIHSLNHIIKNIHEQQKMLDKSHDELSSLYSGIPCALHIGSGTQPYFQQYMANQQFFELIGYTKEDFQTHVGGRYVDIIHPEDRESIIEYMHMKLQYETQAFFMQYRIVRPNGKIVRIFDIIQQSEKNGEQYIYSLLFDLNNSIFKTDTIPRN